MGFAKSLSKRFVKSIIRQLTKAKIKGHVESNKQLVNISEGSAMESDVQFCNSKIVFLKH